MATNNQINSPQPFSLSIGGTGSALTADLGGIVYSSTTGFAILAHTTTAGQALLSGNAAAPTWSTTVFPSTVGVNDLVYASSANVLSGLATVNNASLSTNGTGVPTWLALTDGQFVIGSSTGAPLAATATAGTGITISSAHNSFVISTVGIGLTWTTVTAATQSAVINSGYVANHATTPVNVTLPATAAEGSVVAIAGLTGSGGWTMTANTAQTIQFGNQSSSSAGSWSSTDPGDTAFALCIVANTTWTLFNVVSSGLTKV